MILKTYSDIYNQQIMCHDDYIYQKSIKQNIIWEEFVCNFISDNIRDQSDFLDIGANIGLITIAVNNKCIKNKKNINIFCFECDLDNFICLRYNTKLNNNVKLYNCAVGDSNKFGNMSINNMNKGCNAIIKSVNKSNIIENYTYEVHNNIHMELNSNIYIPIIKLDDYIELFNDISIIKIDIEGFEYLFLLGIGKILEKFRPIIIIEIFTDNQEKVKKLLFEYGYNLTLVDDCQDYILYPC